MSSSGTTSPDTGAIPTAPKPVVILGAGGHGRVLLDALHGRGRTVLAVLDPDRSRWGTRTADVPILGGDERLADFDPDEIRLVNGLGGFEDLSPRRRLFREVRDAGHVFTGVRHRTVVIADSARVHPDAQVLAGAVINPGAVVAADTIVNTAVVIEHDCRVGEGSHVASAAVLSGGVRLGAAVRVGTGATVLPGVSIGAGALIGAGAVVTRDVHGGERVVGVPARAVG